MRVQHTAASSSLYLNVGSWLRNVFAAAKRRLVPRVSRTSVGNKLPRWKIAAFDIKCRKEDLWPHMLTALLTGSVFLTLKTFLRPVLLSSRISASRYKPLPSAMTTQGRTFHETGADINPNSE